MEYKLDEIDLKIVRLMQENARINNAELARILGMAPSAVLERVKKLEQKEVLISYHAKVNPSAVNQNLLSFVFIKANEIIGDEETGKLLAQIPEVLEVHDIAGDDGYIIKVRTSDTIALMNLMKRSLSSIPGIISTRTIIVLQTVKEDNQLIIT
ncbi:Lrp/AsnC family transcriptional regulator [Elizabethkingia meningoseptica]|jgi:Lrp/AsnC family leucine-responsive transcriptional regulator|uniref:AsnC family transcriptional regulator n=3 Tax=Elizabethkingia TaxID=308865 RepID=A0A1V3U1W6_ELIME|nr:MULTISPECIES: Lrp/AsnC family transcriptional regulator [Elizabethkingia]MDR2230965.1 Lrp/AsnC family transcriptional regulator [Flavobacteriaceae bacterium]AQX06104.1 AsnC family transcriptional regulator [Elizabethkingia meningoseptica]AQX10413.1 AsnC family transcriptional regulator [Elizabethkingia ursingii]AQX13645.1 AsnC family transcriptional regulator [Elizabethkingia meningoseptica]AQX48150.1 AsnC family transcriptional regulator [Elizabethkingia meningoseptica]